MVRWIDSNIYGQDEKKSQRMGSVTIALHDAVRIGTSRLDSEKFANVEILYKDDDLNL